jgi:hypothetical protein
MRELEEGRRDSEDGEKRDGVDLDMELVGNFREILQRGIGVQSEGRVWCEGWVRLVPLCLIVITVVVICIVFRAVSGIRT